MWLQTLRCTASISHHKVLAAFLCGVHGHHDFCHRSLPLLVTCILTVLTEISALRAPPACHVGLPSHAWSRRPADGRIMHSHCAHAAHARLQAVCLHWQCPLCSSAPARAASRACKVCSLFFQGPSHQASPAPMLLTRNHHTSCVRPIVQVSHLLITTLRHWLLCCICTSAFRSCWVTAIVCGNLWRSRHAIVLAHNACRLQQKHSQAVHLHMTQ